MNERVPLSFLLAQNKDEEPPVEPVLPFAAMFGDEPMIVTAVLERTAILATTTDQYERVARRHDQVLVDPAIVEWRTKTATYEGARLNGEARNRKGISNSPWRVEMATTYEKLEGDRADQRTRSDERALENQKQVRETAQTNRRLLRLRQPVTPARPEEKEEVIVQRQPFTTADVARSTATATSSTIPTEKLKHCKRCGEDKDRSEFAATGIYGGYCSTCEPLEKADRAAARGGKPATASDPKKKRKYTRRAVAQPEPAAVIASPSHGYDNVIKLLHRRDALKLELAKVNEQLQEALA